MLLPSLVLFIPLCRCVLRFVIICLLPEEFPLTSLVMKVYWRWIHLGFVYWKKNLYFTFIFEIYISNDRILGWLFSSVGKGSCSTVFSLALFLKRNLLSFLLSFLFFPSGCFQDFILVTYFEQFDYDVHCCFSHDFWCLGVCCSSFLNQGVYHFHQVWETFRLF